MPPAPAPRTPCSACPQPHAPCHPPRSCVVHSRAYLLLATACYRRLARLLASLASGPIGLWGEPIEALYQSIRRPFLALVERATFLGPLDLDVAGIPDTLLELGPEAFEDQWDRQMRRAVARNQAQLLRACAPEDPFAPELARVPLVQAIDAALAGYEAQRARAWQAVQARVCSPTTPPPAPPAPRLPKGRGLAVPDYRERLPAIYRRLLRETGRRPTEQELALACHIDLSTLKRYVRRLRAAGAPWPPPVEP